MPCYTHQMKTLKKSLSVCWNPHVTVCLHLLPLFHCRVAEATGPGGKPRPASLQRLVPTRPEDPEKLSYIVCIANFKNQYYQKIPFWVRPKITTLKWTRSLMSYESAMELCVSICIVHLLKAHIVCSFWCHRISTCGKKYLIYFIKYTY